MMLGAVRSPDRVADPHVVRRLPTPTRVVFEALEHAQASGSVVPIASSPYTHLITLGSEDQARAVAAYLLLTAGVPQLHIVDCRVFARVGT